MKWNAFTLSIISVLWTCKLLHFIPEHVWAKQRSDCVKFVWLSHSLVALLAFEKGIIQY
jgi:hypothetical protein